MRILEFCKSLVYNKLMKLVIKSFALFCGFFIILLSASCSRTQPGIPFGFIKLVLYQGDDGPREHFSFFIIAEDEDGIENLDELFLFHDRDQLRWHFRSDEWVTFNQGEQTWIGSRSITSPDGVLPRGVFRAVLVNQGGERGERSFTYDGDVRFPFPELEISDGFFTVRSEWPINRLVGYDRMGNYAMTIELTTLTGAVSELNLPTAVRTVALWAEDTAFFSSAFTNVVPID